MQKLSEAQRKWLERIAVTGTWPDRPFLNDRENSPPLMRAGLVEVVAPGGVNLPYARITEAGRALLDTLAEEKR
jgi:hypothetical protein